MPAPWLITVAEVDKKEKKMSKTMIKIIKDIIILTKVKQVGSSIMNDLAFTVSRKLEERFGGSWAVNITKDGGLFGSESGSFLSESTVR